MRKPALRKLKGIWYIRYNRHRKEKLKSTGTKDRKEAERILDQFTREVEAHEQGYQGNFSSMSLTFRQCTDLYLKDCKRRGVKPSSVTSYKRSLKYFSRIFPYIAQVNHLHEDQVRQFIDSLNTMDRPRDEDDDQRKPSSINVHLRDLRTFMNWLFDRSYIPKKIKVKLVKVDRQLPKILTPDELQKIYNLVDDIKLLSTFKVYEHTGMRLTELHSCTREGNYIRVSSSSKGRRERLIPLPIEIEEDFEIATTDPYLPERITRNFTRLRKKAGVVEGKTLHSLRHTFAARTLIKTNNPYVVKSVLGHQSLSTTEIYLNFPEDYLKEMLTEKMAIPSPQTAQA